MPAFQYIAVDRGGHRITGEFIENDEAAVVARLRAAGHFPSQVRMAAGDGAGSAAREAVIVKRGFFNRVSGTDMLIFSRQMANLVRGGLPIISSFAALISHTESGPLRDVLIAVKADVEQGTTLWEALAKHPRVFPQLFVSMVRAGEASGELPAVLEWLANLIEQEQTRKSQVRSAMAYPILLILVGSGAVGFLLTFLIPRFVTLFEEMEQALPLPTQILITASGLLTSSWWALLIGMVAALQGVRIYGRTPGGRYALDRLKLRVPLFGKMWRKMGVARMARVLGTLLQGGVPILEALAVARGTLGNEVLGRGVDEAQRQVREGERLGNALALSGLFPLLLTQMVSIGEETGDLGSSLDTVSRTFEVEVDSLMKSLLSMLEPLIIIVMGGLIAFIVMAMLLPVFQMNLFGGS